jgi:hypothetical protein
MSVSARERRFPLDPIAVAKALGGEARGNQIDAPGPGHSAKDRSMSVKLDPSRPGGFVVYSFAGDPIDMCLDHVNDRLGLEPWQPVNIKYQDKKDFDAKKLQWHQRMLGDWVLCSSTKVVLGYLMHFMNEGSAWPSQQKMADELGISPATVKRGLQQAEERRWLTRKQNGFKRSNTYMLAFDRNLVLRIQDRKAALEIERNNKRYRAARSSTMSGQDGSPASFPGRPPVSRYPFKIHPYSHTKGTIRESSLFEDRTPPLSREEALAQAIEGASGQSTDGTTERDSQVAREASAGQTASALGTGAGEPSTGEIAGIHTAGTAPQPGLWLEQARDLAQRTPARRMETQAGSKGLEAEAQSPDSGALPSARALDLDGLS